MRRLLLLALLLSHIVQADDSLLGQGHVAHAPIKMNLIIADDGEVKGNYLYTRIGKPIPIFGKIANNSVSLKTVRNPNIQEQFTGTVSMTRGKITGISGKWYGKHTDYGQKAQGYDFQVTLVEPPLSDRNVTCTEMEQYPEQVFQLDDLGSGYGSPYEVDYRCPKSLDQLDFLANLLHSADEIRGRTDTLPNYCTGSIIHAQWRYFHFDLARLGYYPQKAFRRVENNHTMEYFEEWSNRGIYNRSLYDHYMAERARVSPLLADWYQSNYAVDEKTAQRYTNEALQTISTWGFGSISSWHAEPLVPHTDEVLNGASRGFSAALPSANRQQKLNSLNHLLPRNPSPEIVRAILAALGSTKLSDRSESPISNAVQNPTLVSLLLDSGFDSDHQNIFGKTPLFYAIQFNALESARILLAHGADVSHRYQLHKEDKWTCSAIKQWGRTPLMHAAQHADVAMLKLLLDNGANLDDKDVLGSTALDYARNSDKLENANFLKQFLAGGGTTDGT